MENERAGEQASGRTLFEKVWQQHLVRAATPDTPAILYVDLHLIHEVTSPQAFTLLRDRGLRVRRPDRRNRIVELEQALDRRRDAREVEQRIVADERRRGAGKVLHEDARNERRALAIGRQARGNGQAILQRSL